MIREVQSLLKARNTTFRCGDGAFYTIARANLKRGVREAKAAYRRRIKDHLRSNNTRQVWQGVQHITGYKSSNSSAAEGDTSLAEELNIFFARFEATPTAAPSHPPFHNRNILMVEECEVRRLMRKVNPRKAAGPDGVAEWVLKACVDQLAIIFNQSLSQATVPSCLKSSIIVPLLKNSITNSLNDFHPVALTSVIMKSFGKLVQSHIIACLPADLEPFQFAYKAKVSTEDTVATALHAALTYLE
ncbi:uncharacterized protein LOC120533797 [Polypterus senegalus]|uniref:uncharacterized protein LOC120533797 n=1 Tax=Polypterus senegalus TaxID=55291 RepID=UPI00196243A0|nr:uncharacterized protein LOC120533797 [Polypterus senegalus]XP_039616704.1 uncharacterized protein LOC120533797 [Polypterus senegalus]